MDETKVNHVIVLMMENRSFDHMLGYLDYPPGASFEGVKGREKQMGNLLADGKTVNPGPGASYLIDPGPDHSHDSVMRQLLGTNPRSFPYQLTNNGFAMDYERLKPGDGARALECFTPDELPILATLAKEFAVCDHWHCSVPGATWPNRNFVHSATSDGEVNITTRAYTNKTIFEQLSEAGRDWAIYYGGFPPQSLAFTNLWATLGRNWLQRFKPIEKLYRAIRDDRLPHYAFIEPDMLGKTSDSQHPGMGGENDFRAGERLIWQIYQALYENPTVFNKTLLLITYDEHGGFFDHVPPPQGPEYSVYPHFKDKDYEFTFDLLGARVPAVLVSPWIAPGTVDHTVYDHASVPATLRKMFQVAAPPLSNRDAKANTFERILSLENPRDNLPRLGEPFVDQKARSLAQGLELRESLAWILRDLVWTQLKKQPGKLLAPKQSQDDPLSFSIPSDTNLPAEVNQEIQNEILPQLSPEAQQALAGADAAPVIPEPGDAVSFGGLQGPMEGFNTAIKVARHWFERLIENSSLIDDATHYVDLVLRKYYEDKNTVLRTADDFSIEQPDDSAIHSAITGLFDHPETSRQVWMADYEDRWLSLFSDGHVFLFDLDPEQNFSIEKISLDQAIQLFKDMRDGNLQDIRKTFTTTHQENPVSKSG